MHPFGENSSSVPAFLAKLWRLVEDSNTNNLISWSSDGRSFIIQNQAKFSKELLPLNYKHNNMASFIRQLNMYGFHKITSIDNGGLKFDRDEMEFSHPYFQKGHPYLLEHIKRKIANPKQSEEKTTPKAEAMNRVLSEVKNMRGRQESLDSRFSSMKQENEALWREVAILRQKHMKQQQIVNKLIQFLVTLVQPTNRTGPLNGMGGKRRFQLMINDAPQASKVRCITDLLQSYMIKKSEEGPVIHELTEELLDEVASDCDPDDFEIPNVESPASLSSPSPIRQGSTRLMKNLVKTIISSDEFANFFLDDDSYGSSNLNYDEIDEIDTKNMAIYDEDTDVKEKLAPLIKKEIIHQENEKQSSRVSPIVYEQQKKKNQKNVSILQQKLKREPEEETSVLQNKRKIRKRLSPLPNKLNVETNANNNVGSPNSNGTSLLLTSKNNTNNAQHNSNMFVNNEIKSDDILSQFLNSSDTPNQLVDEINIVNQAQQQQPQQQSASSYSPTSSSKNLNNDNNMMYGKDDFLVPNEMPHNIFDENSQNSTSLAGDDMHLFDGVYNSNLNLNNYSNNMDSNNMNRNVKEQEVAKSNDTLKLTKYNPNSSMDILKLSTVDDYTSHLDKVQYDLDSLKDLLRNESYQVDTNTLLGQQNGESNNFGRIYLPQQSFDVETINKVC